MFAARRRHWLGLPVLGCVAALAFLAGVCAQSYLVRGRARIDPAPDAAAQQVRLIGEPQRREADLAAGGQIGPIRCRLSVLPLAAGEAERDRKVRVELTNVSDRAVRLWYASFTDYHITFMVREGGHVRASFSYASLSSTGVSYDLATGRPRVDDLPVLTLKPGATERMDRYLRTVQCYCQGCLLPGDYQLEAVFHYADAKQSMLARSTPIDLHIPPWRVNPTPP
jgi:hypothetical protein